jgi:hypothetical protein
VLSNNNEKESGKRLIDDIEKMFSKKLFKESNLHFIYKVKKQNLDDAREQDQLNVKKN